MEVHEKVSLINSDPDRPCPHFCRRYSGKTALSLLSGALAIASFPPFHCAKGSEPNAQNPVAARKTDNSLSAGQSDAKVERMHFERAQVLRLIKTGVLLIHQGTGLGFYKELHPDLRFAIGAELVSDLSVSSLPRSADGILNWDELLEHEKKLTLLSVVQPEAFQRMLPAADRYREELLSALRIWNSPDKNGFINLALGARILFQLALVATPERAPRYLDEINMLDELVQRIDAARAKEFIKRARAEWQASALATVESGAAEITSLGPSSPLYTDLLQSPLYRKNGQWFYTSKAKEHLGEWRLELLRSEKWQENSIYVLRNVANPLMLAALRQGALRRRLQDGTIEALVGEALQNYEQESAHAALLKSYDFPADAQIVYLRVFARARGEIIRGSLVPAMLMRYAMKKHYGERLEAPPIIFAGELAAGLSKALLHRPGLDKKLHFHIELFCHGGMDGLDYDDYPSGARLATLLSGRSGITASVSTIACYGGGIRKSFQGVLADRPDLGGRIAFFLQAKPHIVNETAAIGGRDGVATQNFGTLVQNELLDIILHSNCGFGEAFQRADERTKAHSFIDAEAVIDGELISSNSRLSKFSVLEAESPPWLIADQPDSHAVPPPIFEPVRTAAQSGMEKDLQSGATVHMLPDAKT